MARKVFNRSVLVPRTQTYFPKGHVSWNKGTKGMTGPNSGSFVKGQSPKNRTIVGDIRTRYDHKDGTPPIKWIKIAEPNKWKELRRFNWEKNFGPIPVGLIVTSIDGDTLNCEPSNLKLITRRENALRNRNYTKASATRRENNLKKKQFLLNPINTQL